MSYSWRNLAASFSSTFAPDWTDSFTSRSLHECDLSEELDELLHRNRQWADRTASEFPGIFTKLAKNQTPKILWIGCSDSRVPETEIFKANPGDFFVHRNIANIARSDDTSLNSVLEYAIEALQVEHIIVCGHYCCGGVQAAMDPPDLPSVSEWIQPLADIYKAHKKEFSGDDEQNWRTLVHYNVQNSIEIIKKHPSVAAALDSDDNPLKIHHWVYDVHTGLIVKPHSSQLRCLVKS